MKHYTGEYFCTQSHWDGDIFDAKHLVVIDRVCLDELYSTKDFSKLVETKKIFDEEHYEMMKDLKTKKQLEEYKPFCNKKIYCLKANVKKWIIENVKDQKTGEKAWCMGEDSYNVNHSGFTIFFWRKEDAVKFIENFSEYKRATEEYNADTGIMKRLNLKTKKMIRVKD